MPWIYFIVTRITQSIKRENIDYNMINRCMKPAISYKQLFKTFKNVNVVFIDKTQLKANTLYNTNVLIKFSFALRDYIYKKRTIYFITYTTTTLSRRITCHIYDQIIV